MGSARTAWRGLRCHRAVIALLLAAPLFAQAPELPRTATAVEIGDLVRKLGDERYTVRVDATRRLCALGPQTAVALKDALQVGGETSLRAQRLLSIFDQCFFWGAAVELSFSAPTIRWDESVDLLIRIRGAAAHPVRLPFELTPAEPGTRLTDAQQVGVLFDIADFLRITDPDGNGITAPTTDDLADDPDVQSVIDARAENTITTFLPPGEELTIRVENFNRGWSRYRLLDSGKYDVSFEYYPEWSDPQLAAAEIGRVVGNSASIEVVAAAPPAVSRDGADAGLEIVREEKRLAAYLVNHRDKAMRFNTAFGSTAPFAQFSWSCTRADESEVDIPLATLKKNASQFQLADLREVAPGDRILIAETTVADLFADFSRASAGAEASRLRVRAVYNNVVTRNWQRRENVLDDKSDTWPETLRGLLPPRILATRQSSDSITLEAPPTADSARLSE